MGMAYVHLKYIEELIASVGAPQEILFLGRQNLDDGDRRISSLIQRNYRFARKPVPDSWKTNYVDKFMLDCDWATKIDTLDFSNYEGANIIHNLNEPINHWRTYDLIIDGGTLEHVFNVPIALENISSLLKIGGRILHFNPANNYMGHGFYQFSPEFFSSFYCVKNGFADSKIFLFDPKRKKKLFRVQIQNLSSRIEIRKSGLLEVWCDTRKSQHNSKIDVQQTDYVVRWEQGIREVRSSNEELIPKYGKMAPLLKKIKANKYTYLLALSIYNFYKRFFFTGAKNRKISSRNLHLVVIPWK